MLLNDAVANAEAQTCALADRLSRIERIENALRVLEAGTGVEKRMTTLPRSRIVLMVRTPPLAASMASKALLMMLKKTCIN